MAGYTGPMESVCCRFIKRFWNEGSPIAEQMLRRIAALYGIGKAVRGKEPAGRPAVRREHSATVIAALKPWIKSQLCRIPQDSQLGEDICHTLARRDPHPGKLHPRVRHQPGRERPAILTSMRRHNSLPPWGFRRFGPSSSHQDALMVPMAAR